jgi:hypothetical protein
MEITGLDFQGEVMLSTCFVFVEAGSGLFML